MDYKESTVAGTKWQRCSRIDIDNRINVTPTVAFYEEVAINTGEEVITKDVGQLYLQFDQIAANKSYDIINPETGVVVDSMTGQQIYAVLHSLYMATAKSRDILVEMNSGN